MNSMRWLQWSTIDLRNGLGGVEVHARSLQREFTAMGVRAELSRDRKDLEAALNGEWDVVHVHGSAPLPLDFLLRFKTARKRPVLVHTLHGTTLGRMIACGEFTWPGGYAAYGRELRSMLAADVVLGVHPAISLLALARKLGKITAVCSNGWDASFTEEAVSVPDGKFWVFVGRGGDRVKGTDRISKMLKLLPDMTLVAAPGDGFEESSKVLKTGVLSSGQVRALVSKAAGLILASRYEGLPLVVLEALALGTPVVSTAAGGVFTLPRELQGLFITETGDPRALADAVRAAERQPPEQRALRAAANRKQLPTWRNVAEVALSATSSMLG